MSNVKWTFSPYNEEVYKKSKNRVMFVGADPNAEKKYKGKIMKGDLFDYNLQDGDEIESELTYQ